MKQHSPSLRGKLVAFEGCDGAGKTVTAMEVYRKLLALGHDAAWVDKKDIPADDPYVREHLAGLKSLLWNYPPDARLELLGNRHWLHLLTAWFAAIDVCVVRPLLVNHSVVVVDSWYYKFAARFSLKHDVAAGAVESALGHLTSPDIVFFLDTPPELLARRRPAPKRSETGEVDDGSSDFVGYQGRLRTELLQTAHGQSWEIVPTAGMTITEVCTECVRRLARIRL